MASFLTRFFGRTASEGAAFAIGGAVSEPLTPPLRDLTNAAWSSHPSMPLSVTDMAMGVAQGQVDRTWATGEAALTGFNTDRFNHLIKVFDEGPGVAQAYSLWRRGRIDEAGFRRAAKREALEPEWINALVEVKNVLLDESVIANAVQQGHVPTEGILPPPVSGGTPFDIPLTTIDLSPTDEAAGHGLTKKRLQIQANLVGLPPGDHEMLDMWNRGIITEGSVDAGLREGHRKTKWTPAVKELRWAVLTGIQVVNLWLRGWIGPAEAYKHGHKVGYTKELMDLLYKGQGRPLSWHQTWIGLQRGGVYDGPIDAIHPAFLHSLRQSSIRPEWYNLAWHSRYTYPSAFVMRALTSDGTLTAAQAEADLLDMGWRPDRAKQAAEKWAGGTGTTADPNVTKAHTQLWSTIHSSFLAGESSATQARATLTRLGIPAAARTEIISLWTAERELIRKQLTPAQIKKAMNKPSRNYATGANWTRDDALAALIERGYSSAEANDFLDI